MESTVKTNTDFSAEQVARWRAAILAARAQLFSFVAPKKVPLPAKVSNREITGYMNETFEDWRGTTKSLQGAVNEPKKSGSAAGIKRQAAGQRKATAVVRKAPKRRSKKTNHKKR